MAGWVKKPPDVRRNELLDSAQDLFFSKGYEATTVADIMERAGVSKGGFYHHFTSKDDLLEALVERMATRALARLQPILEENGLDAVACMNAVLSRSRQLKAEDAPVIRATFDIVFRPENVALYHRLNRAVNRVMMPLFVDIITRGKMEGRFRIDDPTTTAEIIVQLGASTYNAVARAIEAVGTPQADEAAAALDERLRQHGLAIDRILGLPDGTLVYSETGFAKAVLNVPAGRKR